ncbi:hypothetical protein PYCCODRAFT_1475053 [Trametes coccinea BRFM310]|uniref:Aminotransferase n=1 Tax=Trametes coccinea (strain BRFM310) TaxID=1353009 RepID=A0A1Y2IYI3_TRAC3|nr:hypothetical protein PYCCODRAFT_1475053 [Trametes coccinea BRFM310]
MSSPADFQLISTTRYEDGLTELDWNTQAFHGTPSPYLLLAYHYDRLLDAARVHAWPVPQAFTLHLLESTCNAAFTAEGTDSQLDALERSFRIRILLSYPGILSVAASPVSSLPSRDPAALSLWIPDRSSPETPPGETPLLVVHLDTVATPSSNFTRTKTTRRDHYTAARNRFSIPPPPTSSLDDVLLYNDDGEITETSIRNVAFARGLPPRWLTPPAPTGCLPGVMRRWLLEQGRIVEAGRGELVRDTVVDGEYVLTFNGLEGCRIGRLKLGP